MLAKLSPPRMPGVIARGRLFDLLDAQRQHAAVWVDGPPGAGKTTLVASYLQARHLASIWYQVDSGDTDPASFFHYLVQASLLSPARRRSLPALTPECASDLPAFTRRFFRAFFARLPATATLVLDNCQEAGATFHDIVRDLLKETRDGIDVIVTSRHAPPEALARTQANGQLGRIGWEALRLTTDEAQSIASVDRQFDAATLSDLARHADGWAAGLVLLLQGPTSAGVPPAASAMQSMEMVFGYFAGQVFDDAPAATRDLLLRTAFLPRVSEAAARALTGNPDAGHALAELHRRRLFTERQGGASDCYQYHALFREFLIDRIHVSLSPDERRQLKTDCAELLAASGDAADAVRLHVENADWNAATALILACAAGLVVEGRWRTLEAWIALLPREHVARTPWLTLWRGNSLVLVAPARARALLELAFDRFLAAGDELGQAVAATGIIECHNIESSAFTAMDPWLAALERLLNGGLLLSSPGTRLRVHAALMLAAMHRQPDHWIVQVCVREGLAMLQQDIPASARADIATQLLQFFDFTGDLRGANALVEQAGPLFAGEDLSALRRSGWLVFYSYHAALVGRAAEGFEALDRLRGIARESGLTWFGFFDLFFRSLLHLLGPAPLAAAPLLHQLDAILRPERPVEAAQYQLARVLLYQAQGEPSLAVYHGELCIAAAEQTGGALYNVLFPTVVASAFVECGHPARALSLIAQARSLSADTAYSHHEALMLMTEAYACSALGDASRAQTLLAQALARGREDHTESLFRWLVVGFGHMLDVALRAGIEADAARSLIERFAIAAPSPDAEAWPWPVRICTLGRFELVLGGVPLRSQRKLQKKPLDMLKYVIAQGGREVSAVALETALWPDAEGGAAAEAFEVTLRRLRKLLGDDDAIELKNGKLALNPGTCWLDTWAFERAQGRAEAMLGDAAKPADDAAFGVLAERVLSLYRGHFLAADDEAPWSLACRERLASKFLRHVVAVGQRWQERGDEARAEMAYRQALELDPLAESLYRRLMSLQLQQGRRAESLETYRRCRQMLSVVLGLAPSADTEVVHRRVVEGS
ncbi:MAG: BTAD domain-containing putative transcriptional regulator [Burkholderiales bacterium]